MWGNHAKDIHWTQKNRTRQEPNTKTGLERKTQQIGGEYTINETLLARGKTIFPPLLIELGLLKQYVKALDKEENCFRHLCSAFPGLSEEKLKAGIFDELQIQNTIRDKGFSTSMTNTEKKAWLAFVDVVSNLLGNRKTKNFMKSVNEMLPSF